MGQEFTLDDDEQAAAEEFIVSHECLEEYAQAISYKFTQTGIGMAIEVFCDCGASENITNYAMW